jgi:hypothetical protein
MAAKQLPVESIATQAPAVTLRKLKEWEGIDGLLHSVVPEGEKRIIAGIGHELILLPNERIRTKGGTANLKDWIGQRIALRCDVGLSVGLLPMDEKEMRILQLEEVLADMVGQFSLETCDGQMFTNGMSAMERAFQALGLSEGSSCEELACFSRWSEAKAARERAIGAVV